MLGNALSKKAVAAHPTLFGALVGLLLLVVIAVLVTWFPGAIELHDKHKRLTQAVLFTATYFAVYIYGLRRWRRLAAFWPTILILFALHVAGIFFYSTRIAPILVWQWPILGLIEYYLAALLLEKLSGTH